MKRALSFLFDALMVSLVGLILVRIFERYGR